MFFRFHSNDFSCSGCSSNAQKTFNGVAQCMYFSGMLTSDWKIFSTWQGTRKSTEKIISPLNYDWDVAQNVRSKVKSDTNDDKINMNGIKRRRRKNPAHTWHKWE